MTGTKQDLVRKHLVAAGLTNEDCEKYVNLLRRFLAARLTKARFEVEKIRLVPTMPSSAKSCIGRSKSVREFPTFRW
jgi:hypothetical protein